MENIREERNKSAVEFIENALNFKDWNKWVEPTRTALEAERIKQYGFRDDDIIAKKRDDEIVFRLELKDKVTIAKMLDFVIKNNLVATNVSGTSRYNERMLIEATFQD